MLPASFAILLSSSCLYSKSQSSYSLTELGFPLFKTEFKINFFIFFTLAELQEISIVYNQSSVTLSISTGANRSSIAVSPSPSSGIIVSTLDFISSSVIPICSNTFTYSFLSPGLCAILSP